MRDPTAISRLRLRRHRRTRRPHPTVWVRDSAPGRHDGRKVGTSDGHPWGPQLAINGADSHTGHRPQALAAVLPLAARNHVWVLLAPISTAPRTTADLRECKPAGQKPPRQRVQVPLGHKKIMDWPSVLRLVRSFQRSSLRPGASHPEACHPIWRCRALRFPSEHAPCERLPRELSRPRPGGGCDPAALSTGCRVSTLGGHSGSERFDGLAPPAQLELRRRPNCLRC